MEFDDYSKTDEFSTYVTICGEIENIVYTNEETGYAVLEVVQESDGGRLTVVGCIPYPGEGERIIADGNFVNHMAYGSQFKVIRAERMMPSSLSSLLRYLSSGAVKGIGPVTARGIIDRFKTESLDIIAYEPERLTEVKGISQKRAKEISTELTTKLSIRNLMVFLAEYNLSPRLSMMVYKQYGTSSIETVTENPYVLSAEPFYADFPKVDYMALSMGFSADNTKRIEAGVLYEMNFNQNEGHVFLPFDLLANATATLLSLQIETVAETLERLSECGVIRRENMDGYDACYTIPLYNAELYVANRVAFLVTRKFLLPRDIEQIIDSLEKNYDISYAAKQREAILCAVSQPVTVLTGGPGTGKTTTIRGMISIFDIMGLKTALAAPTGRAAKRMSELCGRESKTIHRLLEVAFDSNGMKFQRNAENPLEADVIILDEVSMIDISLMASLLAAVKNNCRLVLVGDPDQLPSVGPGNVLKDILASGVAKIIHLDEIFRQARESDIILSAHAVNRGEMPILKNNKKDFFFMQRNTSDQVADTVVDLCARRLPNNMGIDPEDIQVLTPLKRNECGVEELNRRLQNILNPHNELKTERVIFERLFRVGDRVMQIRNNYDMTWKKAADESPAAETGTGVFNGDIGIIRSINLLSQTLTIDFDDRRYDYEFDNAVDLELAYAITVHKAQGSEFKAVIFVADARNSRILNRSLLYTAITRARELLVIVGNTESLSVMVSNKQRYKRLSGLKTRLLCVSEVRT